MLDDLDEHDPYHELAEIQKALQAVELEDWHNWSGSDLLDFWLGLRYPLKIKRLIDRIFSAEVTRFIVAGPRGGGKSMLDAAVEFLLWVFRDFDVVNMAGSENQALGVYQYLRGFLRQYKQNIIEWNMGGRVQDVQLLKDTMRSTVRAVDPGNLHTPELRDEHGVPVRTTGKAIAKDTSAFIAVLAASQKQVRGPHAGSEVRGGLLVVDEEGEVEGDLFNAAKYTVNTARPSIILRTSTYHNATGTFAEDFEDPDAKGWEAHHYSIFDVSKRCPYSVVTDEDWGDLREGRKRSPGDNDRSIMQLPVLKPDCSRCPRPQYFRDPREIIDPQSGELKEIDQPYCGGAAAYAENGWFDWKDLLQLFDERPNDENFETELLGRRPTSQGYVIKNRQALQDLIVPDEECAYLPPVDPVTKMRNPGAGECIAMIDWGMQTSCPLIISQNRTDLNSPYGCRVLIHIVDLGRQDDSQIRAYLNLMRQRFGVREVWADGSHPYNNQMLQNDGFDVHRIHFVTMKPYGVGTINAHIEKAALRIPKVAGKSLISQLKNWRRRGGSIIKKNDHFPDSLLCGLLRYRTMFDVIMPIDPGRDRKKSDEVNSMVRTASGTGENDDARHPQGNHNMMVNPVHNGLPAPMLFSDSDVIGIDVDIIQGMTRQSASLPSVGDLGNMGDTHYGAAGRLPSPIMTTSLNQHAVAESEGEGVQPGSIVDQSQSIMEAARASADRLTKRHV